MVHNSKLVLGIIAFCIYVTISAKLHLYGLIISCRMDKYVSCGISVITSVEFCVVVESKVYIVHLL